MDAILVRGQPYQTVVYRSLAPVVSTVHTILHIDGIAAVAGATITGKRFVLDLNSGATWTVRSAVVGVVSCGRRFPALCRTDYRSAATLSALHIPKPSPLLKCIRLMHPQSLATQGFTWSQGSCLISKF